MLCVAGPFSATSKPMADACLRSRVHYLDITGEINVFEALAARDADAKTRGVTLYPRGRLRRRAERLSRRASETPAARRHRPQTLSVARREHVAGHGQDHDRSRRGRHAPSPGRTPTSPAPERRKGHATSAGARSRRSRSAGATSRPRIIRPAFPTSRSSSRRRRRRRPLSSNRSSASASCKASSKRRSTEYPKVRGPVSRVRTAVLDRGRASTRLWPQQGPVYDPWHYVPVLARISHSVIAGGPSFPRWRSGLGLIGKKASWRELRACGRCRWDRRGYFELCGL